MQKWEYIVFCPSSPDARDNQLNLYGSEGWELVAIDTDGNLYLKRPVK